MDHSIFFSHLIAIYNHFHCRIELLQKPAKERVDRTKHAKRPTSLTHGCVDRPAQHIERERERERESQLFTGRVMLRHHLSCNLRISGHFQHLLMHRIHHKMAQNWLVFQRKEKSFFFILCFFVACYLNSFSKLTNFVPNRVKPAFYSNLYDIL